MRWLEAAQSNSAQSVCNPISLEDQADEMMMMGLRLNEGVNLSRWEKLSDRALDKERLAYLTEIGMLRTDNGRLYASQDGRMVLNTLLAEILVD